MTVRVPLDALSEGERLLDAESSRYLCRVLRLDAGERFVAFDPTARSEADATLLEPSYGAARVRLEAPRPASVVATTELVLVYALAKGDKIDAVVRDATELGATRIVLAPSARSVVKLERGDAKQARWRKIAEQAARQCGRADVPSIEVLPRWTDALAAVTSEARFCLDPRARTTLGAVLPPASSRGASIAFAVGPEGGLAPEEIEAADAVGFVAVSIGSFILRTETAAAAVLAAARVLQPG